jgi:hypothetical protein
MGKLYTFGCSFTHGFHLDDFSNGTNLMIRYRNWRLNQELPKIWPEIVADCLGLDLDNHGWPGSSVYKIFDRFCKQSNKFTKDDVVILEWTRIHRFRLYSDGYFPTILPIFNPNIDNGSQPISKKGIIEFQVIRTEQPWINEIYSFMKLAKEICDSIGCELYFWSADDYILNKEDINIKKNWKTLGVESKCDLTQFLRLTKGAHTIYEETNGVVDDQQHYGEMGHKIMGELFCDEINKYRNNQY